MHHLNSYFILEQVEQGNSYGRIKAATLFLDISGFTRITEALMDHGQYGAEVLANIVTDIFEPLVASIYSYGGDITHFAGDAFQAIFPYDDSNEQGIVCLRAFAAATFIQEQMQKKAISHTEYGEFEFTAKVGLSVGELEWGMITGPKQDIYYFRGNAIDECATAENLGSGGDIIAHHHFYNQINAKCTAVPVTSNNIFFHLTPNETQQPLPHINPIPSNSPYHRQFTATGLLNSKIRAEFRYTCNLFLNVSEVNNHQEISHFMETFFNAIEPYDGYINRLAFGDKGCHLLLFWGAPTTHENDLSRALNFALALKTTTPVPIRMGITYGIAHAGYIGSPLREEYTCYGHRVNMAARLMNKADWGSIWIGDHIYRHAQDEFDITYFGDIPLKGVSHLQSVYLLEGHQGEIAPAQYTTTMIGRETELTQLHSTLAPIFAGQFAGIITVYGEAGIGKSRLIYELKQQLTQEAEANPIKTMQWLYCPVDEILRQPLNPFRYWMRKYFNQSRTQSEAENKRYFHQKLDTLVAQSTDETIIQELRRTVSILGAILDLHWPNSLYEQLEPKLRSENRQLALINLIKAETMHFPVILEIEDGHWLDNESKELIGALTRNLSNRPLAILLTNRYQDDGTVFELPVDLSLPQQEIHLNYLSVIGVQHLAEQTVTGKITQPVLRFLMEKTNGNPFFTEQLLLDLKERERILPSDNRPYIYDFRAGFQLADVPANLRAVLVSRLDRLIDETREIVQMAAVLGQEFDIGILQAMAVEFDDLAEYISQGESEQIWSAISKILYAFKHALLRDAAYGMQLQSHLQQLHALAAFAYETLYADTLPEHYASLAYHYEQAELDEKAIEYLKLAGDAAKNSYQNDIALNFYDRLLNFDLSSQTEIDVRRAQGEILYIQGNWEYAISSLLTGLTLIDENVEDEIHLRILLANAYCDMGEYEQSKEMLQIANEFAKNISNKNLIADSLTVLSRVYLYQAKYEEASSVLRQSYEIANENEDQRGIARALSGIGAIYGLTNRFKESFTYLKKAIDIFEEINEKVEITRPIHNAGLTLLFLGHFAESAEFFHRAVSLGEKIGDQIGMLSAFHRLGQLHHAEGQNSEAIYYFKKSVTINRQLGDSGLPSTPEPYLAWAYFSGGNYPQALEIALTHLKNVRKKERDVENGLAHMVIGLILTVDDINSSDLPVSNLLDQIQSVTNLDLNPTTYFNFAINASRDTTHLNTLIPSLTYYGGYLYKQGSSMSQEKGLQHLSEAKNLADIHEMGWSQKNIISLSQELGITFDDL